MPDTPYPSRQRRLSEILESSGFHALLVNPGPSLVYLTGLHFHLSERPIVGIFRAGTSPVMVLPELEKRKLEGLDFELRSHLYGEDLSTWADAFRQAANNAGLAYSRIAVEPRRLRVLELRLLEAAAPHAGYLDGTELVSRLRMYKDGNEVALMKRAVQVAEEAAIETLNRLSIGVTEKEIAGELTIQMLKRGSEPDLPFAPIVAFGEKTANPHAVPGERDLREGDIVLLDWGASIDGYFSDLTRMYSFGEPADELSRITGIVEEANRAAREAAGPGVTASTVDRAARDLIQSAGYGEYFVHRTGHGLGLDSHEEPYIRGDNEQILEPGMSFTIEPGIYLPGVGGARIEDDVVVTKSGIETLSTLERSLTVIPVR
ncbi:MAG: Xaa-Pro peptidase family protein [Rhodothermales bacterium]